MLIQYHQIGPLKYKEETHNMKKILALVLAMCMVLALCACGQQAAPAAAPAAEGPAAAAEAPAAADPAKEPYHVKLSMSTLMVVPAVEATQSVADAINDYLKNTLGETDYVIDLEIVSIADYFTTIPMELAGGEGSDIVQVFDMANFVDQGYIVSLDPYLDNELKPTVDLIGNVIGSGVMGGSIYMMPRYYGTVLDWKFIFDKDMADAAGIDCYKATDMDSLEGVLAELKAAYPDEHFLVYSDQFDDLYDLYTKTSRVGTYGATVGDDKTIYNYYETESFKTAIQKAYEWRQKGYLDPEGSANTLSHDAVVASGSAKGVIMGHSADCPSIEDMFTTNYGVGLGGVKFGASTIALGNLYTDTLGVGVTYCSEHPELAARFINLLYTDEFVWNTLIYGVEGQDYVWLNDEHTLCDYPEGLDMMTVPYSCMYSCGMIGNGFQGLPFPDSNSGNQFEYGMELMQGAWCPPLYGFTPVTASVMNEYAAVANVVEQYEDVLVFGDVNPDDVYPQFIQALKDAGIDALIAEYNAQGAAFVPAT